METKKAAQIFMLTCVLIFLCDVTDASDDCNLPFGDPPCECCSENWGGGEPPFFAYIVFRDIERTGCDPNWVMLPAPNNRLFQLRCTSEFTTDTCAWSYNLDDVGGVGGVYSDIWVIGFDLTAYWSYNVYLANKLDDPPVDMVYFYRRGRTDCRRVYRSEYNSWECAPFKYLWTGGTARIFWLNSPDFGDFNGDGIANFEDYAILAKAPESYQPLKKFADNWLLQLPPPAP